MPIKCIVDYYSIDSLLVTPIYVFLSDTVVFCRFYIMPKLLFLIGVSFKREVMYESDEDPAALAIRSRIGR